MPPLQRPPRRRALPRGAAVVFGVRVAPVRLSTADLLLYRPDERAAVSAGRPLTAALRPLLAAVGAWLAPLGARWRSSRTNTLR